MAIALEFHLVDIVLFTVTCSIQIDGVILILDRDYFNHGHRSRMFPTPRLHFSSI